MSNYSYRPPPHRSMSSKYICSGLTITRCAGASSTISPSCKTADMIAHLLCNLDIVGHKQQVDAIPSCARSATHVSSPRQTERALKMSRSDASSTGYPGSSCCDDPAMMITLPPSFTARANSFKSSRTPGRVSCEVRTPYPVEGVVEIPETVVHEFTAKVQDRSKTQKFYLLDWHTQTHV